MENNQFNGFYSEENNPTTASEQTEATNTNAEAETEYDVEAVFDAESADDAELPYEVFDTIPEGENALLYAEQQAEDDVPSPPAQNPKKLWQIIVATAIITSILTALICGAFYFFTASRNQSTIIYRDGNDLRSKIDLMQALGLNDAEDGKPLSVTGVANRVGPTVVGISTRGTAATSTLFGLVEQPFAGSGTGFIISTDGYIVTNNHVIANADEIVVTLDNDSEYPAKLIGTDSKTDLAVLKIEKTGLTPAVLGSSGDVQVGEAAIAIGNPLGLTLSGTVTAGIISATNRKITVEGNEYTLLQTDAAINNGNSGGPLLNAYGEVIGINNAKISASGVEGLGFAIPADIAKPIIEDLIAVGYVRGRPLIGINGRNITEEISEYYHLPIGVYVVSVVDFSAAEKASLQIGDVITHCNGQKVTTVDELNAIRDTHASGDTLTLTIVRADEKMTIELVLGEDRPSVSLN